MMNKELKKPEWAGRELRLDPFHFPQVVTYAADDGRTDITFTINERGAVIRQVLPSSGLPMSIALPINAFVGVTARAVEDEYGEITVTLELMHKDAQLSVPLLVAHDLTDVAADWRAWAQAFNLPMMLVEEDGIARPLYESTGPVRTGEPQARRQGQEPRRRRPRFLARRKTGTLGVRMVIEGKEIIARN
ncbi:hypothetical protein KUG47_03225 [Falsochrobactrum sp. TDYN1]|uniref:Uncharacterized protein n=1 Tax=Falsochrobactrum tianjinense TaxID=2706015 RepID=A0A949PKC6_9HYPH|nr:DUF6101 family protein [Falsochrobactrum sp. TDYN1]MBV2142508.1 hypothetical protein [Falsochrobactrum sp. TDYN1]